MDGDDAEAGVTQPTLHLVLSTEEFSQFTANAPLPGDDESLRLERHPLC